MIAMRDLSAAREAAAALNRSRTRLYPPGTRVFVMHRLAHRPYPDARRGQPMQRIPADVAGRYAGPDDRLSEYYDADTDRLCPIHYHTLNLPDGDIMRALPGDIHCLDLVPAPASAVLAPPPRALILLADPLDGVRRLVSHLAAIARVSGRGHWTADGALRLGSQTKYWTIRPGDAVTIITRPDGSRVTHAVALTLDTLIALARTLRERAAEYEIARLLADLRAESLPSPEVGWFGGILHIASGGSPRLRIVCGGRGVVLSDHITEAHWRDGQHAARAQTYACWPGTPELGARIKEVLA
jgi:hypothetical protein